jgi:ketosteroid isomerase-like protein
MRALALIVLAAGCSPEIVTRPPPPPVSWRSLETQPVPDAAPASATAKERALADAYMHALSGPDLEGLAPLIYEDAHFSFAGTRDAYGRDDIVAAHRALFGKLAARSFGVVRVLRTDSAQSIEWVMTATEGARPVALRGLALLWTRDDGTIADIHFYFDEALLAAAVGQGPKALRGLPPPAPAPAVREEVEQAGSPEEAANLALVGHVLDALENDAAAYVGAMRDDVEINVLEAARPARGRQVAAAYYAAMQRAIARLDTQLDNGWGIGRYVVVEYHIVGEQRAPIGFVPVGKDPLVKLSLVDVVELTGGKIARIWRYDNPMQIASP